MLFKNARDSFFGNIFEIINYFSPIDQCYNKHFNWSVIGNFSDLLKVYNNDDVTTNCDSTFDLFSQKVFVFLGLGK